ncbi:thioredoxin-disulfide reductase [Kordiimonas lacus]|uniref:Thioredoxin reductase n=1 Tax=Kordiimonas lacus TaxID=637679 RepID=A0A1G7EZM9_9PROT|nr:thioredoxin-disulfide reductase [Kordiimonas lacus]SDE68926.1 thioredoxin reductase (NADPH) [Kordiimonas lacus]
MAETKHTKMLIIGSGPAGYTAAIYAARANLSPTIVTGMQAGGQLTITTDVENYPGFAEAVQGPDLMEAMRQQAENVGTDIIYDLITEVDLKATPKRAVGDSGTVYTADTIVISTGAQAKWLGLETEQKFNGYGVSACATCDGFFYRGKDVVVIGGGNTAVEEALYLSNICSKVTLVHRRDELRSEKILQDRLFKAANVEVAWDSVLDEVLGDENPLGVTGVRLKNVKTGDTRELDVHGVFIAIGHKPSTELFKGQLPMDDEGYLIKKPDSTETDIPGVYAAGDVTDKVYRQAVTAAGMGCMAALEAEKYIATMEHAAAAAE